MIKGSITALITPFRGDSIDEEALRKHVERQIAAGTEGLVPVGTTGESPTLSHEEDHRVTEIVVDQVAGRIPVIAGTGSNSTTEAISLTKHAKEVGASAALMITPYYNKPSQKGIFNHFAKISEAVDIPIIFYNHQGRTGATIQPETIAALAKIGNFIAVKDASGGICYSAEVIDRTEGRINVLSGNDTWTPSLMAIGAVGCISVVSNIIPAEMKKMISLFADNKAKESMEVYYKILPLMLAMELDVNPVPVKEACALLGYCTSELRPPLAPLDDTTRDKLIAELRDFGLLK